MQDNVSVFENCIQLIQAIAWPAVAVIVHGAMLKDDENVIRILDTGLALLEVIKSIKISATSSD